MNVIFITDNKSFTEFSYVPSAVIVLEVNTLHRVAIVYSFHVLRYYLSTCGRFY